MAQSVSNDQQAGFLQQILRYIKKHPFKSLGWVFLAGVSFVVFLFLGTWAGAFGHVPNSNELAKLENPVTSTVYGSDKKPIAYFYLQNRSNIDSTQLNPYLVQALVATEDVRFYEHSGIDYRSYGRVFVKSILMQQGKGGGSTITQQIAKNVFGRKDLWLLSTPINKMREVIIAKRLESIYSKEELLLLYFNTVSFGENLYGIEKAAQRFFSKSPDQLNLSECATLVGVLKAPSYYNPRKNPQNSTNRRNVVLQQMVKNNAITQEEADAAKTEITLKYSPPEKNSSLSGYYKEYIRTEFNNWAAENPDPDGGIYDLEIDGLQIYTTLQPNIQKYAEQTMERNMVRLQKLMDQHWTSKTTDGGKEAFIANLMAIQPKIIQMKENGMTDEQIMDYWKTSKSRKYWEIGKGFEPRQQTVEDSIISSIIRLHTGILAMNSRSGAILGYLGGIDYGFSQIDNIKAKNQVGSTFKPITYLTALDQGIDPCDYYDNSLRTYSKYEDWQPKNSSGGYGGSYSLHGALANSVNTVSAALQLQVGVDNTIEKARKMGITSDIPEVPSIVLGTANISLMEMVMAYASISNGGNKVNPYMIQRITDQQGTVLYEAKPKYDGGVASVASIKELQQMMGEVLTEGTGAGFSRWEIPYNIIGKTGTTQNNGDGWFIGASPEIVIGSWVGARDKRVHFEKTYMGSGANTAMPMVASMFKSLSSWRRPMLTNFEYARPYFPCPPFTDQVASEATNYYKTDSTYLEGLRIKDSLLRNPPIVVDSVLVDSLSIPEPVQEQAPVDQ
ncbi:transglycosylase domain-containing protein [Nonlabens agnitus]|uniref:Peptidoglycan glycosyltransferase n=1 Tax=Nonlabens agnitus TaxID=870484 RepID=A0A2S9WQ83_9FLAO|nr:transglycosylase domain-containing protein [Nonlabens agnitus]PRP65648.1 peptidoglycan glycosyltransferase [Nonlabens agnitus]